MNEPTQKQKILIELYTQMALTGYIRSDEQFVKNVFSDMEILAFKDYVSDIFKKFSVVSALDYGCGGSDYEKEGFFDKKSAREFFNLEKVYLYEPARGIDSRALADAVLCFDVLEHIFIADLPTVIRELFSFAKKVLIVNVACYPANALLPNGENAHITVRPPFWWKGIFDSIAVEFPEITVQLWCSTQWRKVESFNLYKAADWLNQDGFVVNI
jgi:hypothetical protein